MNYLKDVANIRLGGGNLLVNLVDNTYEDADRSKFTAVGATEKESGGVLRIGEKQLRNIFRENDTDEPAVSWVTGQDVSFEVRLMETSVENIALALGGNVSEVGNNGQGHYKLYRFGDLTMPKSYPMIYEAPDQTNTSLVTTIIMPKCEVVGALDLELRDDNPTVLKLFVRVKKAATGSLAGRKLELRRSY